MTKSIKATKKALLVTLLKRSDFLASAVAGSLLLSFGYYLLLLQVSDLGTVLYNLSYEPIYRAAVFMLVPLVLILFGLNFALAVVLFRAKANLKWQGGALLGALTGGFAASCPVCGAFLLSLIGVAGGLSVLPFAGLEVWLVAAVIIGFTFWRSIVVLDSKTCDPKKEEHLCWQLPKVKGSHTLFFILISLFLAVIFYVI
ncbi:MAG: hypothetical protein A2729_00895 [Candidatus Buchananbacteria bacterium RIFCSPHIGHO2_01_FULL_39_14]|uniref:Uncharacterized protein n=1 Tax=Candidatus Buchananbacteria bacterium RIFCSPHIGHO2_01_FULL_39_14 TaxID=1797532 RepID=A0A1G1XVM8_9BACT|nr:MAG: hypothetical protein A2729_00895 [Candidatus Buchananbacteria bacterium RIFCSPHIGHO2_01_FULL_39_14]